MPPWMPFTRTVTLLAPKVNSGRDHTGPSPGWGITIFVAVTRFVVLSCREDFVVGAMIRTKVGNGNILPVGRVAESDLVAVAGC